MVTSTQPAPPSAVPATPAAKVQAAAVARRRAWLRPVIIAAAIAALLVGTYIYAYFDAANLSSQYLRDADASYDAGNYLEALVGYEEFDPASNAYVTRGGYLQIEKIWKDPYAWPKPPDVERAEARIDEIINKRITVPEAEQFVQANLGKRNPYFGVIYLRLGELYEQEGDTSSAKEIYETVIESFPDEPDLVNRAKEHLARLNS